MLEIVAEDDIPEEIRSPPRRAKEAARAKCAACRKVLNRSLLASSGKLKSCPRCSVLNGHEHVYLPYPEAFGTTEARITDANPDGVQSYCEFHRKEGNEDRDLAGGVLCSNALV